MPVTLEPARLEWLEALAVSDDEFTERFSLAVISDWIGFPDALPHVIDAARRSDADPWGSHLIFDDDGALVGFGGFKGAPADGAVEIGYAVAPARQGRGIATAAIRWMLDQAERSGVSLVVAHTLPGPNASTRVLQRCGFVHTATVGDPADTVKDVVWRWEHAIPAPA